MPVGISIRVTGLDRVIALFDRLPTKLQEQVSHDLHQIVEEVRDEAKQRCPVDTGSLRKSIRVKTYSKPAGTMQKLGVSAGGYIINPKTGRMVDYASFVEYGTSRNPPQPFLRPAYQNKKRRLKKAMKEAAKLAIKNSIH